MEELKRELHVLASLIIKLDAADEAIRDALKYMIEHGHDLPRMKDEIAQSRQYIANLSTFLREEVLSTDLPNCPCPCWKGRDVK